MGCRFRKIFAMVFMTATLVGLIICSSVNARMPNRIRVGIITQNSGSQLRNASAITFLVKGTYQLVDLSAIPGPEIIGTPNKEETWQVLFLPTGMQIYQNGQPVKITTGPVIVKEQNHDSANRVCLVNYTVNNSEANIGKWYRGNMEFQSSTGSIVAINELPVEEYLSGVVPREMSNSWPIEALKAQAIAARTYVAVSINKHLVEGFNLLDTQTDQVYGGFNSEGDNANQAVMETSGQIMMYNGIPISAVYHSTSGGFTEDNENVWSGKPCDYLRAAEDPYSISNGLSNWTYTTTMEEINNKLSQAGSGIGPISTIQLEKFRSGRVKTVIIKDINGNTVTKSGSEFGRLFNPKFYTSINTTSFMSNFFDLKMDQLSNPNYSIMDSTGKQTTVSGDNLFSLADDGNAGPLNGGAADFFILDASGTSSYNKAATGTVVFQGRGWGHGVGMSQWGAYNMALGGKGYQDILKFYYQGAEIVD